MFQLGGQARTATFKEFALIFMCDHIPTLCPEAAETSRQMLRRYLVPGFGPSLMNDITMDEVADFQLAVENTGGDTDKTLMVLSQVFTEAIARGYRVGDHPVEGVSRKLESLRRGIRR